MNISKFFIDRPIFAGVISVMITLAGALSVFQLPISEYPEVVPPSVVVRAQYPGANPKVLAETVAAPLEEAINGVEDMLYMQSQANSDGNLAVTVSFNLGTDPDKAQQLVQNRVAQALPRLPEEVQRLGVTTTKSSPNLTMVVHLISPDQRYDTTYLRNYAVLNVKDRLARIEGVGEVQIWGAGDYAMRVWLDPGKMAERELTAAEAAFFPRLMLTGTFGYESADLGNLLQWSSRTFLLGPLVGTALSLPIFDGGRREAGVERARAQFEEDVANYRQTVLQAFREVEDGLASLRILDEQTEVQDAAMAQAERAAELSNVQYREGSISYLDVLD